ncbi:MAG: branched-chain amino acid transport system II carrier protein [Alphaproteobacteria bacterium]|nr:branched-chain amino acid transport system II carrier protein [Alphaproteobacteria bacterium]
MFKTVLTAGFAMFSMFFGSGNLVFPLLLGTQTLSHANYAMCGFFITAVIVPFLGLISMIAFEGHREKFFSTLGANTGFLLTFIMLALMGPFGVMPRCITVAYGGVQLVWPAFSFSVFSAIFCVLAGLLILRPGKVVSIIGLILTPFKLGGIVILILFGLYLASPAEFSAMAPIDSFNLGFSTGYQTMDLMAAFFFSATIVYYLRDHLEDKSDVKLLLRSSLGASLMGAFLLTAIYVGFIMLGASYAPHLTTASPEALLASIAGLTLGKYALVVVSTTLAVSCLATTVILANLFAEFVRVDIAKERLRFNLSNNICILLTVGITFVVAQLGFSTICKVLGTVLELTYPALIALAMHHILTFWFKINYSKIVFWSVLGLSLIMTWVR